MLRAVHALIILAYVAAPIIAMIASWRRLRRRRGSGGFVFTLSAAIVLGTALAIVYGVAIGGRVSAGQVLLTIYFAASLLFILKALDGALVAILTRAWRGLMARFSVSPRVARAGEVVPALLRVVVLMGIGLPYVMAAVMTYRPKVVAQDNPMTQLGFAYSPVRFKTSDGLQLVGWWIPGEPARRTRAARRDTVIVCHGLGSGKANALVMARQLVPHGYNLLIFDFRAHGESDGQLTSMGAHESRDVLAAVKWVRENHPQQSQRILGLGASMGAAALISAASDDSPEGQAISAVAVYDTFDDLPSLAHSVAVSRFVPPLSWVADRFGLALASFQTGADLENFRPSRCIAQLWPRPVMVIHAQDDLIIPFQHGQALFDAASEPKRQLWVGGGHNQVLNDESVAREVRDFFDEARAVPAI